MPALRLTELDFDRYADADDLHLLQSLRVVAQRLDGRDDLSREEQRLASELTSLLGSTADDVDEPGPGEDLGNRHGRFPERPDAVDRARAAMMAYGDWPDATTAGQAADALAALRSRG